MPGSCGGASAQHPHPPVGGRPSPPARHTLCRGASRWLPRPASPGSAPVPSLPARQPSRRQVWSPNPWAGREAWHAESSSGRTGCAAQAPLPGPTLPGSRFGPSPPARLPSRCQVWPPNPWAGREAWRAVSSQGGRAARFGLPCPDRPPPVPHCPVTRLARLQVVAASCPPGSAWFRLPFPRRGLAGVTCTLARFERTVTAFPVVGRWCHLHFGSVRAHSPVASWILL